MKTRIRLLATKLLSTGFRAKNLETNEVVSVKTSCYRVAEFDTVMFALSKEWTFNKNQYVSGEILENRFDPDSIDIPGHQFREIEPYDPSEWYSSRELQGFIGECMGRGRRMSYEFEDYTGFGFYGPNTDPVYESTECDTLDERYAMLMKLFEAYPQCIDAIVHVGYQYLKKAFYLHHAENCFRTAILVAQKNLPPDFDGIILWSCLNNRPYLRALHGLLLTQWRQGVFEPAAKTACTILRLNPPDNHGVRFLIDKITSHEPYSEV